MKDKTYKFMIRTGKYLLDEYIQIYNNIMFFDQYNENGQLIYIEYSDGNWIKREYDNNGQLVYRETSKRGVILDER